MALGAAESARLRQLRWWYGRLGKHGSAALMTAVTTAVSVSSTVITQSLFALPTGRGYEIGLVVATVVPLVVTPILAYGLLHLIDHLFALETQLRHQAWHDVLTGLPNRRWILARLEAGIADSARTKRPIGVLIVDVDRFKVINDQLGHQAGDVVLREVARRIRRVLRRNDFLGRYGGEEFLLVTHDVDAEAIRHCAERVRAAVAGQPIPYLQARLPVTVSVGGAIITRRFDAAGMAHGLHDADRALYMAKAGGRNRVELIRQPA